MAALAVLDVDVPGAPDLWAATESDSSPPEDTHCSLYWRSLLGGSEAI